MKKQKYKCPAEMTIDLIGGKWKVILFYNLRKGPKRFGELKRLSPGITPATLTKQLNELIDAGFLSRTEAAEGKVRQVYYRLSPLGESLKPILYAMVRWGIEHQKEFAIGKFEMDPTQ